MFLDIVIDVFQIIGNVTVHYYNIRQNKQEVDSIRKITVFQILTQKHNRVQYNILYINNLI